MPMYTHRKNHQESHKSDVGRLGFWKCHFSGCDGSNELSFQLLLPLTTISSTTVNSKQLFGVIASNKSSF